MADRDPQSGGNGSFLDETAAVLGRVRAGLAEVIAAVPEHVADSADLHRALRIQKTASWRLFKAATATDPLAAAPHVPTPAVLKKFFEAAAARGVEPGTIESAERATADLERLVSKHAGDRATFDSMVGSLLDAEESRQIGLAHRRLVFRGLKHILGMQAKTQLKFMAVQPAADPTMLDLARVEGIISLRQLRSDAPLIVSRSCTVLRDGCVLKVRREPLSSAVGNDRMSLISEFCSEPLPEFRETEGPSDVLQGELISRGVGRCSAITCFEGHVIREVCGRYWCAEDPWLNACQKVRTPCEAVVLDVLVREGTFGANQPSAASCCEQFREYQGEDPWSLRNLPTTRETVNYLGRGASVLQTQDFPRYAELARHVFDHLGWNDEAFDVYRCRIEYPVVPSTVMIYFDLPKAPGAA
ncbi:MAG: hypothetical protein H6816_02880 [Phycisphaerales bacterium]|nr:hypothetical protein [Phycisphaerales bacterium]